MESAGLTIDDVQVEIVGTGAILTALTEGQVDAIVFSKLRTIELNNSGFAASEITCDQFNVLVAGDKLVAEDPETVDGFCRALNKAIEYIIDGHVEEAVDMSIEKYAPTFAEKRDVVVQILNDVFVKTLWQSDYTKENGIGASNPEKWQALIDESKESYEVRDVLQKIQKNHSSGIVSAVVSDRVGTVYPDLSCTELPASRSGRAGELDGKAVCER